MDSKKIQKSAERFLSWLGFSSCSLIIKLLPSRYLYTFARQIGSLGYVLAARQRRVALESLSTAFGKEKSRQEIEEIARDCFISMAKSGVELSFLLDRPLLLEKQAELVGRQNLDNALSRGKGVILVSAHFGNFPLLIAKLALSGYRIAGIMRPMRDERMERIFLEKRNRLKIKTIYSLPRDVCVQETLESLRNNEVVFIPIDQNFGTGGVFVEFFGRKAATATGPVVFAKRTGAAILPCFIVRQSGDRHKIIFEPALALEESEKPEEATQLNIQKLTVIIEAYIRKYPAHWGWIHRRWKTKPN
jgi:KDO2-lipid IV(A) lauroyltransferase